MEIKLKSNRKFLIKIYLPLAIICGIFIGVFGVGAVAFNDIDGCLLTLVLLICFEAIVIGILLFAKFYKGKSFVFNENEIVVYKRGNQIEKYLIKDIEAIHYYKFKLRYIITIFAGALMEGGCWKLHIWLNNGEKKELAFFSIRDVIMIKERLYHDLIIY